MEIKQTGGSNDANNEVAECSAQVKGTSHGFFIGDSDKAQEFVKALKTYGNMESRLGKQVRIFEEVTNLCTDIVNLAEMLPKKGNPFAIHRCKIPINKSLAKAIHWRMKFGLMETFTKIKIIQATPIPKFDRGSQTTPGGNYTNEPFVNSFRVSFRPIGEEIITRSK